jgi:hypothetical protein
MLAFIAIFFSLSLIASVLVIAASMLSSRLNRVEEQYLAEEYEAQPGNAESPASEIPSQSS